MEESEDEQEGEEDEEDEELDDDLWIVEKIQKMRYNGKLKRVEFLVLWEADKSKSWEPIENFHSGYDNVEIERFRTENPEQFDDVTDKSTATKKKGRPKKLQKRITKDIDDEPDETAQGESKRLADPNKLQDPSEKTPRKTKLRDGKIIDSNDQKQEVSSRKWSVGRSKKRPPTQMAENETSSCMKPREKSTRSQAEVYLPPLKRSRSKCQVSAPQPSNSSLQLSQCISESVPRRSRTRCRTTSDTTIEEDSMIALSDPKNHNFMQNKNTASGSRNKSTSQMGRSQSKASDDVIISEVSPIVTRRSRSRSHVSSLMENPPPLTRSRSIPQKATTIPTTRSRSRGRFELSGNSGAEIRIERNLPRPVEQSSSRHGQSQSEAIIVSEVSSRRSRSRCRVASLKETPPSLSTTRSKPIQQEKSIRHPRSRSRSRVVLSENSCAEIIKKRNPPRSKSVVGRPQSNNEDEKKKNQKVPTRVRSKSVSYEISKLVPNRHVSRVPPDFYEMQILWTQISEKTTPTELSEYKSGLQKLLTGRVSCLKPIFQLLPTLPIELYETHEKLYSLFCEITGAFPFKYHQGSNLISRHSIADKSQIGAQILLECLSQNILPFDVVNDQTTLLAIHNFIRIGIKDMLEDIVEKLPKGRNVITENDLQGSLSSKLLG